MTEPSTSDTAARRAPDDFLPELPPADVPLPEPYYFLGDSQRSVIERRPLPALAPYAAHLPGWVPHKRIAEALGFGTAGIDAAVERFGPGYVWASEFENVHSTWDVVEPPFVFRGVAFRGSEQLFQMQKQPEDTWTEDYVRRFAASTPGGAYALGRECRLRADWDTARVEAMRVALRHKFCGAAATIQNARPPTMSRAALRALLVATAGRPLVSVKHDAFWGAGSGRPSRGANKLPLLLEELREKLRESTAAETAAAAETE